MSGAEAIAAIQVVDACIGIAKTIIDIGRAVKNAQGLPPKLRDLLEKIPAIEELLESARKEFEEEKVAEDASKSAQSTLKQCEQALSNLRDILRKACPREGDNRSKRMWKAAKTVVSGRDSQVQKLLEVVQNNLKLLEQKEIYAIGDKLDELHSGLLIAQESDQFPKIKAWLSPTDPEANHVSARERYEPQTGFWLLQSNRYTRWKAGGMKHLWLYGKPGCGKTVLCSTVIEDIRAYCKSAPNSAHALFYFSFFDNHKQSYESLLRSLVVQLGWREPGWSMLVQAYEKPNATVPGTDELEKILSSSIESFDEVFVLLDALDECPESGDVRQIMLERLERLSVAPNLRIFATSREVDDIRESMEALCADTISIAVESVDADILSWVSSQLSRDRKLIRLDQSTKAMVEETISQKADGMFRWAYCQLHKLKTLKAIKPKYVKAALLDLPSTLDETYERMLCEIQEMYRDEALILLRWLSYAQSPPSLGELAEASIINPRSQEEVDIKNRGSIEDPLRILSGLVTIQRTGNDNDDLPGTIEAKSDDLETEISGSGDSDLRSDNICDIPSTRRIGKETKVRLAHFSVKEYLESKRILQSGAKEFFLKSAIEHEFLAHSCLTYLVYYTNSDQKTSDEQDLIQFSLLKYAARSWYYHATLQQYGPVHRYVSFLSSEDVKHDWLLIHEPERSRQKPFTQWNNNIGSGLYYASFIGLEAVVNELIRSKVDVNAQGGEYGNALQAASVRGHEKVVSMLIDAGADVNVQGGLYGNALQAASDGGYEKVVSMLIDAGADVNAQGGEYGNALQAASVRGHEKVVSMLIDAGADVNAQGSLWDNALHAASVRGYEKVVSILIDAGADINAQDYFYGNALQAPIVRGHKVVSQERKLTLRDYIMANRRRRHQ